MMKKIGAMMLTFLMLCSCAACGSSGNSSEQAAPASEAATADTAAVDEKSPAVDSGELNTLVIGTGQICTTLDPTNSYDGWYAIRFGLCQTLTQMNDDMTISGWLVEDDYTVNDDMTQWTFRIRDGITFSNGDALTADAVKNSLEYTIEHANRTADYFNVSSIEVDGQTLVINTESAEPILPNKLADPLFSILNTEVDNSNIAEAGPVGTGPFVVEAFDSINRTVSVVRNENYWGGEVKQDRVEVIFTEDQSALSLSIQNGDFDALYNISMTEVSKFENNADFTVEKSASGRTTHGFLNQNGVLGDDVLRTAVIQLLDRQSFVDVLLNGQYVAGKTLVTSAAAYGYDELNDPYPYDPEAAVKNLEEAGYKDVDGDGYLETPSGDPIDLQFVYYTGRPEQEVIVEAAQMELSKVGIKVTPVLNESSQVQDRLGVGDFDMLCMSINVMNCADPENHLKTYFKTGGSCQAYGWSNAEFDGILDALSATADPNARIQLVKDAEQILLDEAVFIPFCYPIMNFVLKSNVSGIRCTTADYYWISENTYKAQ